MIVLKALQFAAEKHGDQMYGDGIPYITHCACVMAVLSHFGVNVPAILAAGVLHDVLEDTKTTQEELSMKFGVDVSRMVHAVTNPKIDISKTGEYSATIKYFTRKEKHEIQYPIIARNEKARIIKLADRIANVESGGKFGMYRKEHEVFKKHLYVSDIGMIERNMRAYLDDLIGSVNES
jgi:guanosine-3',5'-bis(diphosphate) 3'-pyrophosphohydrolase